MIRCMVILLAAAASVFAAARTFPGSNIIVVTPAELTSLAAARERPYIAYEGIVYDMQKIWTSINADEKYAPASDLSASVPKRSKEAKLITEQPVIGFFVRSALSPEQLARCNGRNGTGRLVAYSGVVFDFSSVKLGGRHHPPSMYGRDIAPQFPPTCGECHAPDVFHMFRPVAVVTNE